MINNISIPIEKTGDREKIAGYAIYLGDMKPEGMLYAKTLRSDRPRARISKIDIPSMPEGYYIVDKNDVPGKNRVKIITDDQPIFAEDTVNYIGEPILLVVGPDKQRILELISEIHVEYQDLEPIFTMEAAENRSLPPIYGEDNCFAEYSYSRGNADRIFSEAKLVVEDEYETGYQEHIYMEPQGMLGVYEDNRITVYGSFQCPYYVSDALIQAFGWDSDRIRAVQTTTGGAFGGKEEYPSLIAGHVAIAAFKTGHPVQLIFDRTEDIEVTSKRHPSVICFKTALDDNNKILAIKADVSINAGAYAGLSSVVLQRIIFNVVGVYNIPNLEVYGKAVATNTVPAGAFRGFGGPQAFFAIEMHMHHIAKRLGLEPLDFKKKHMVKTGDPTATGGTFWDDVVLPDMIKSIEEMSGYREKVKSFNEKQGDSFRGIGVSLFYHGCGFTGSGERDHIKAVVKLRKYADGKVEILVSNVDMGQGLLTTFSKIVANTLELPIKNIIYVNPDTSRVPNSGPTVASRSVMIVGKLLEDAAIELKSRWNEASELEIIKNYKHPEYIKWDEEKLCGDAYPAYSWGVNAVEVEVDKLTYQIDVKGVWTVFDVGKAIDERIIQGQIEGGVLQGLGLAALEVMNCKGGKLQQRTITDYVIPTAMDFAKVESKLIDNPYKGGPFGAKGAGELTVVGAAPALAAAVCDALGVEIHRLPVTPEYLMEVAKNGKRD